MSSIETTLVNHLWDNLHLVPEQWLLDELIKRGKVLVIIKNDFRVRMGIVNPSLPWQRVINEINHLKKKET